MCKNEHTTINLRLIIINFQKSFGNKNGRNLLYELRYFVYILGNLDNTYCTGLVYHVVPQVRKLFIRFSEVLLRDGCLN
jgi:hypothetical protein